MARIKNTSPSATLFQRRLASTREDEKRFPALPGVNLNDYQLNYFGMLIKPELMRDAYDKEDEDA